MKRYFLLTILLVSSFSNISAQTSEANSISDMLKNGDVNGLSGFFMNNVDLTILDNNDVYSKAQATQVTKRFFEEHPPNGFVIKHEGKSKMEDHYRIGTLRTAKGTYRVTYFLKNHNGQYLLKKLRIEANDRDF